MKNFTACAFLVSMCCATQAQSTFEKIYESGVSLRMTLVELNSGNILVGMARYPGISSITTDGSVAYSSTYSAPNILNVSSIRKYSDNELYFVTGYRMDSCSAVGPTTIPFSNPVIGRMDSMGNVLNYHPYIINAEACLNIASDLTITNEKDVITWGKDALFFALMVDSNGTPLWARRFSNHGGFQFIKELPSGDLLAGINMDTAGAVVARMDPDGNFLWCKSYMRPTGMVHDCLIESDSVFIITGYTDSTSLNMFIPLPTSFHPKLFEMKLDGAGEVQWCKGYESTPNRWYTPRPSRIERTQDGNYAILATLGEPDYNFFYRPVLIKVDPNGDTLWTRSVGRIGYSYYTADLLAASDGGFVFDGVVWGDLPGGMSGAPFIYKTDSLGHLPCYERHHPIEVSDLFPVDSSFTLTSVDGATMQTAFVNDTVFDPIVVYDACTGTSGMPPSVRHGNRMSVRPNPTPGRVTVQFKDPLQAESYYSVYDALGKLLYQRPLPPGATIQEVDLGRFGKGTYVIKCTDPEGVSYERVVVE